MDTTHEETQSSKDIKASYELQYAVQAMQYQQQQQQQPQHRHHMSPQESSLGRKRKLYAIEEQAESSFQAKAAPDAAYDADVDDDVPVGGPVKPLIIKLHKNPSERDYIYELFQPWALKTYGDQAKTKTITLRKKGRILKALEGKEHSRPDSSKFRFWVKMKGFSTKRPEGFEEAPGSQRLSKPLPPHAVLSDSPSDVDLFVASTSKDFGKRTYRKVAVVEEFFDIIYNVHMELGGRSGMHAGQKRTYRIITETYAFLPREAVTRFLSTCPECKKNLRPSSPAASSTGPKEELPNESSSEFDVLNYSSHTESSLEAGPTTKSTTKPLPPPQQSISETAGAAKKRRNSNPDERSKAERASQLEAQVEPAFVGAPEQQPTLMPRRYSSPTQTQTAPKTQTYEHKQQQQLPASVPKIRINPHLQRPLTPPLLVREPVTAAPYSYHPLCFDINALKSRDSLFRYYEFMRRFYAGGLVQPLTVPTTTAAQQLPVLTPPLYGSDILQGLRFPQTAPTQTSAMPTASEQILTEASKKEEIIEIIDDESTAIEQTSKKFKSSSERLKSFKALSPPIRSDKDFTTLSSGIQKQFKSSPANLESSKPLHEPLSLAITDLPTKTPTPTLSLPQTSAINLSKPLLHFRTKSNSTPPPPAASPAATSTPTIKFETATTPKSLTELRIPQIRSSNVAVTGALPPLDLERLKPITSTYLQLTRSMGLSDEDALRFDNLVSKDFNYSL